METITEYLIKSAVWLTGFALGYMVFLRNERYFILNRAFLVTGIIASICFPWFNFHYTVWLPMVPITEMTEAPLSTGNVVQEQPLAQNLLLYTYLSGILYLVFRLLKQTSSVIGVIRKSGISTYNNVRLVRTDRYPAPFSFFSFVFVNPSINDTETNEIVHHEREHIRQRHWIDLLLFELLCILQWFNPMVWLYGRFIRQNHEYLADEKALQRSANPAMYRAALLNQMFGGPVIQLANSFNYSLNKKRFTMMKQTIKSPLRKLKLLMVLPLIAGVFYAFATPEYKFIEQGNPESGLIQSEKMIKGKVTDENGNPLKNASVIISGKPIGTVTDENGNFMLKVTDESPIVVSYIGFQTAKMNPDFDKEMSFILKTEVIKIGFQEKAVKAATSSGLSDKVLIMIDGKESTKAQMEALDKGTIESVSVLKDQSAAAIYGEKGKEGVILVKTKLTSPQMEFEAQEMGTKNSGGFSLKEPTTLKLANSVKGQPLVIVDGTIIESKNLEEIDPNKIASIDVLKNGSSVEKYGEKGKNGVVLITMKKGNSTDYESSVTNLTGSFVKFDSNVATTATPGLNFKAKKLNANDKNGITNIKADTIAVDLLKSKSLIFIDGKESTKAEVDKLNPENIASVSVLKNKSATSIYGPRANNGVILIESKKSAKSNEEVTVIGYGTKPENLLKSGVQIRTKKDGAPLIVKDGVVSPDLKMDDLNPNEIESINVLKDEPATAKYGEKGKNGVLEITMKKKGEVFSIVEEMPQFPGGTEALKSYIYSTLKYPVIALENGIQGQVFVKFVVSKTGKVTDAKISRGVDPSLDKEAVRIVESMPKWSPGKQHGENVDVTYEMPINFSFPADYHPKSSEKLRATVHSYTKTTFTKSKPDAKESKTKPIVDQAAQTHQLIIVPNPTNDKATISLKGSDSINKMDVSVYDRFGKLIKKESKNGPTFSLSFNKLANGTYFIVVNDGENQFTGQLVVNH